MPGTRRRKPSSFLFSVSTGLEAEVGNIFNPKYLGVVKQQDRRRLGSQAAYLQTGEKETSILLRPL